MSKVNSGGYAIAAAAVIGAILGGLLLSGVILCTLARLKPPPPSPIEVGQEKQRDTSSKDEPKASSDRPPKPRAATILDGDAKMKSTQGGGQGAQSNKESPHHWWHDPVTVFTAVLALAATIQLVIYGFQAFYMHKGLAITRIAADAAKMSADAAIKAVEEMRLEKRAWLSIAATITQLGAGKQMRAVIKISNSGATPAAIDKIKFSSGSYRTPVDHDRRMKEHLERDHWQPRAHTVAPGDYITMPLEGLLDITDCGPDLIERSIEEILFIITIPYADFSEGRETQTYLVYHPELPDAMIQHTKYNYMT